MNTNKCVYLHRDTLTGEVKYIGSGSPTRPYSRTSRSEDHLNCWSNLSVEILHENLTMSEARDIEFKLISESDFEKLFNKVKSTAKWMEIVYSEISELLEYCEDSPTYLRWKVSRNSSRSNLLGASKGDVAGFIDKTTGYVKVKVNCIRYQGHRIVYSLVNKINVPHDMVVDHVDRCRSNNNIDNLRLVDVSINNRNKQFNEGFNVKKMTSCNSFIVKWTDNKGKRKSICLNFTADIAQFGPERAEEICYQKCIKIRDAINTNILNQNWEFNLEQILQTNGVDEKQCKKILKTSRKI